MVNEERQKTKVGEKATGREDFASVSDALRVLPNGLKIPFVLRSVSQSQQLTSGVQEERRKGVSNVK